MLKNMLLLKKVKVKKSQVKKKDLKKYPVKTLLNWGSKQN